MSSPQFCRFCALSKPASELRDLTSHIAHFEDVKRILDLLGITIVNLGKPLLPKSICAACYLNLKNCCNVFERIKDSQQVLSDLFPEDEGTSENATPPLDPPISEIDRPSTENDKMHGLDDSLKETVKTLLDFPFLGALRQHNVRTTLQQPQQLVVAQEPQNPLLAEQPQIPEMAEQAQTSGLAHQPQKAEMEQELQKPRLAQEPQKPRLAQEPQKPVQAQEPQKSKQAQEPQISGSAQESKKPGNAQEPQKQELAQVPQMPIWVQPPQKPILAKSTQMPGLVQELQKPVLALSQQLQKPVLAQQSQQTQKLGMGQEPKIARWAQQLQKPGMAQQSQNTGLYLQSQYTKQPQQLHKPAGMVQQPLKTGMILRSQNVGLIPQSQYAAMALKSQNLGTPLQPIQARSPQQSEHNFPKNRIATWSSYPNKCDQCGVSCNTILGLKGHRQSAHGVFHGFQCADCLIMVPTFHMFVEHVREHRPELIDYCPICNIKTTDENHMNSHPELLSDQMQSAVPNIDDGAKSKKTEVRDLSRFFGGTKGRREVNSWLEYPWVCAFCSMEFEDQAVLRIHLKNIHS
ncbi:hypothetical protein PYW08_011431 [Mythimna loreyi]|uniref:Uncharacterized protein n=1 Tax=Mythimna loreyi TaxID=667449 RepID=A0ACC2Q650_9NEOP|nr:hypothetical protein PYW08_011431 [Mythimna loreyi]